MADLRTSWMGIELKNPIILGASKLVDEIDVIEEIEEAGIAAVVYHSLFEEQIHLEQIQLDDMLTEYDHRHAEMVDIFPEIRHGGAKEHIYKLTKLTERLGIPVFASLNAIYDSSWDEYAVELEKTGIAGLELNFYDVPVDPSITSSKIESHQIRILSKLKKLVKIPVSVKISPFYANPLHIVSEMDRAGADGIVLFNRFFQPEIDIETEQFYYPFDLTQEKDYKVTLRFTGLLYGNIGADICASRGISDGNDIVKMILAGANTVQVVSTIYRNKAAHIPLMIETLRKWMDDHHYKTLNDFRGNLSMKKLQDPYAYKRAHYVDILTKSQDIFKKYPMR
jgi:dihydroorotate dehydrogenase (fumarate)